MICSTGSCKTTDSIWALTSAKKLHRLTFSKSLAEMLAGKTGYKLERKQFIIGERLEPG